ncbi:MAG: substrate-binding domain-containing protein [Aggregatilineales bacterium]
MKLIQRGVGIIFLFALTIAPLGLIAQTDDDITVVGSGIVTPVVELLVGESGVDATFNTNVTGTNAGFTAFCNGEADITTATRPISLDEEAGCLASEVEYDEYLLGHNILTFVTNNEFTALQCLELPTLNTLFAPSAAGNVVDWTATGALAPDAGLTEAPISLYLPPENTALYVLLDDIVDGLGLRADVNILASGSEVVEAVSGNEFALGVVSLSAVTDAVQTVEVSTSPDLGCSAPSSENVENRLYTTSERLFMYVNRASMEKSGLRDALTYIVGSDGADALVSAGFTPPSTNAYATNEAILAGDESGRQFSLEVVAFEIPGNLIGTIEIGGSPSASTYLDVVTLDFTTQYSSVTINNSFDGTVGGARRLCNGEIDIIVTTSGLTDEQAQNCEANNIATMPLELGSDAVVLVANSADSYLECLTIESLQSVWSAPLAEATAPTLWSEINAEYPETEFTLFAPTGASSASTDILLTPAEGAVLPLRTDTEVNRDPLYRAAAVANVEGSLTYMSWAEYQNVLNNAQENIQLVGVDGGAGCITPSVGTISDQSYPLTQTSTLVVSIPSLARPEVQSLLWYMFSDNNFATIEQTNLIGLSFGDLPEIREMLQDAFSQAQVTQLEVGPEATPEAESTPEAEATEQSTPEAEATEATDG